jgi:Gpi18-like mannosyltransferase
LKDQRIRGRSDSFADLKTKCSLVYDNWKARKRRFVVSILFANLIFATLLLYWSVLVYCRAFGVENNDLEGYFRPWFDHILTSGFHALAGEYSNYTPPWLYLLYLSSFLPDSFSNVELIKLPSIVFNLISAVFVYLIVRQLGRGISYALFAGSGLLLLPTVVLNSAYWGQSDIIYCSFLLAFTCASLERRPVLAALCFGLAFAFKLQAIFLGPFLLYLVLRKEISWRHLLLIPTVYMGAMVPAWFAGRPLGELIWIYTAQVEKYRKLSLDAPNLYLFVGSYLDYKVAVGLIVAAAAGLAIAVYGQRLKMEPREAKLFIATASALLMPFLLPKMHDRYFFVADVFTFVLAASVPRFWWLAVFMQVSSVAAYLSFLFGIALAPHVGAVFSTAAVIGLLWVYYQTQRFRGASPANPGISA